VGRGRSKADQWMPTRVYRGKSKFEFRPAHGGCIALCALTATEAEVWAAYRQLEAKAKLTVARLAEQYFASRWFMRKRPSTQRQYRDCWRMLEKVWCEVDVSKVRQKHVRLWMDKRGETSEVSANHEKSVLYNIFAHAFERSLIRENPCVGVKKFPESARDRYIEDEEYYSFLTVSKPIVQVAMEIAYCCGARSQDVRAIMLRDLRDDGIYIRQGKTGKKQIKAWTPRLRDAVEQALRLRADILTRLPTVASQYLVVSNTAQPYTESGFKSLWQKNRQAVAQQLGEPIDWTYHDIKAKAVSDFEGNKQEFSGHKTASQVAIYDRKVQLAPTLITTQRPLGR
jgi:integrase